MFVLKDAIELDKYIGIRILGRENLQSITLLEKMRGKMIEDFFYAIIIQHYITVYANRTFLVSAKIEFAISFVAASA
jgi:hypothetical protein